MCDLLQGSGPSLDLDRCSAESSRPAKLNRCETLRVSRWFWETFRPPARPLQSHWNRRANINLPSGETKTWRRGGWRRSVRAWHSAAAATSVVVVPTHIPPHRPSVPHWSFMAEKTERRGRTAILSPNESTAAMRYRHSLIGRRVTSKHAHGARRDASLQESFRILGLCAACTQKRVCLPSARK
jgi:hypothetical protein